MSAFAWLGDRMAYDLPPLLQLPPSVPGVRAPILEVGGEPAREDPYLLRNGSEVSAELDAIHARTVAIRRLQLELRGEPCEIDEEEASREEAMAPYVRLATRGSFQRGKHPWRNVESAGHAEARQRRRRVDDGVRTCSKCHTIGHNRVTCPQ